MCSNNFQNFSGLEYCGLTSPSINQNSLEQKINQFNTLPTSTTNLFLTKNPPNTITLLNNMISNSSKKHRNHSTSNINNDSQTPNNLNFNSNLLIQETNGKNHCLNFSMNNILNKQSPPYQKNELAYTKHEWPIFDPNNSVPYFTKELCDKVNFESSWSEKIDGSDLPFYDITTLRFFYNLGIHQFKKIQTKLNVEINGQSAIPLIKTDTKYNPSPNNLPQITNLARVDNALYSSDINLLHNYGSQFTHQEYQQVYPTLIVNENLHTYNQELPKLDNQKFISIPSKEVTTELLDHNILSDDQTMPYLEPQVVRNSFSNEDLRNNTKEAFSKHLINGLQTTHNFKYFQNTGEKLNNEQFNTDIDESMPKTLDASSNIKSNFSFLPSTNVEHVNNLETTTNCNNISETFHIMVDNEKNKCIYSEIIPLVNTKKVVASISDSTNKNKSILNVITTEDNLRIAKKSEEKQINVDEIIDDHKNLSFISDEYVDNNNEAAQINVDKIFLKRKPSNTTLNLRASKGVKRCRQLTSSEIDFENDYPNSIKNSLSFETNLESCPLKRSKIVDHENSNALYKCIKKLNNINCPSDFNEDDSKNFNVIISSIEPKLLQALERLTLSYCNGKHYIIEKHNNSLQNAIDKIVSQELSGENLTVDESSSLASDIENYSEHDEEYKCDTLEDNKIIRYIVKTPDIHNTLNQDIDNISIEEKKKFEADVIQEAIRKHLIKPVDTKKSSIGQINIKAYVAMPFFNTYLHYITNEYLNQIEKIPQTLISNEEIVNDKSFSNFENSFEEGNIFQNEIQQLQRNNLSIVPMPIRAVSLDNNFYEVAIKTVQNSDKESKRSNKKFDSKASIPSAFHFSNSNNMLSEFSQNISNLSINNLFNNFSNPHLREQVQNFNFMNEHMFKEF